MPQNLITLSRTALYELVWTKPVRDVAKDFGIVRRRTRQALPRRRVPIPQGLLGQGRRRTKAKKPLHCRHSPWRSTPQATELCHDGRTRRLDAGQHRTHGDVTFTPRPAPPPPAPDSPISPEEAALRARIDALEIAPLDSLLQAHPAVLRTAVHLKHLKSRDIAWPRGTRSGPILQVTNVSDAQMDRALRVLDAVLRASAALGWHFTAPPPKSRPRTAAAAPGAPHRRHRRSSVTSSWTENRCNSRSTSAVASSTTFPPRPTRRQESRPLRLDAALRFRAVRRTAPAPLRCRQQLGAQDLERHQGTTAGNSRQQDPARPARPRARAQARPRRATPARHRPARTRASASTRPSTTRRHAKLIHELECQAGAWHRAQFLRRYLRAARRALGTDAYLVKVDDREVDFLAWAEHYVNQLDPLHPDPREPDFANERTFQYGADDKRLQEELQRLSGHAWDSA